jgi:hypothetical protein
VEGFAPALSPAAAWYENGRIATLEQTLQNLHDAGKDLQIAWPWDCGVDLMACARVTPCEDESCEKLLRQLSK